MAEQRRRRPGRPATLSSESIVSAAIELVEESGLLRIADLGERLGVDGSALYRYFRGRSDLVSAIAESFIRPLLEPLPTTDDWRADFEASVGRLAALYRQKPSVAMLVMSADDLSGPVLELAAEGAQLLRRSGAPDPAVFSALHAVEIAVFGSIAYDTVGGPTADGVRREYHRRVGVFDADDLFPTVADLAEESRRTMWVLIGGALDWLERQVPISGT